MKNKQNYPVIILGAGISGLTASYFLNRFKIKIGFNYQEDIKIINLLENFIQKNENYMLDVNQGWSNEIAINNLEKYKNYKSLWIEEPISADNDYETIMFKKTSTR